MKIVAFSSVLIALWAVEASGKEATTQSEANGDSVGPSSDNSTARELYSGEWFWKVPANGLSKWWYNSRDQGPFDCTPLWDTAVWSMLNAYRSGGTEGVHWKYTTNLNDAECLTNWTYYASDGETVIADSIARTTTKNDPKRWCPLPVYRTGGVKGKQWATCTRHRKP